MSENELNNFVVCTTINPKSTGATPVTTTFTNNCGNGPISDVWDTTKNKNAPNRNLAGGGGGG